MPLPWSKLPLGLWNLFEFPLDPSRFKDSVLEGPWEPHTLRQGLSRPSDTQ